MSNEGGGRYDDDEKVIDITDYVNKKSVENVELEQFTNHFVEMFNQRIIEKQKEAARKRFMDAIINFILFTQIGVIIAICFIITKIY